MIPSRSLWVLSPIVGVLVLLPLLASLGAAHPPGEPEEGAMVEEVTKGYAAERVGIRPGDLLLSWSRGDDYSGPVRSPFDLGRLELEQAPRGVVTLYGTRGGGRQEWVLPPSRWGLRARPHLPEALLTLYEQGRNLIAVKDLEGGSRHWRSAVEAADSRKDPLRAAWLQARLARALFDANRWAEADMAWEAAVQRLERSQPDVAAQLLRDQDWIEALMSRNALDRAEARLRRATALEPEENLAAAGDLSWLGRIMRFRGETAVAEALLHRADAIRERLAPGSVAAAWTTLPERAKIAFFRDEAAAEEEALLQAREMLERLSPESLELAAVLGELGIYLVARGDLVRGEELLRRALTLVERLSPNGRELALISYYLGDLDFIRGDLAAAEERFRHALSLSEALDSESFYVAHFLDRLASLAEGRGDLAAAREQRRRALQITEKLAQNSPGSSYYKAYYLSFAAMGERDRGDLAKADEYLQRALEGSISSSLTFSAHFLRAEIALESGDLALAELSHRHLLALEEKHYSSSLLVSDSLASLGAIALRRGDLPKAEELHRRALAIREELAPGSTRVALSLNDLGHVARRAGHHALAAEHFCRATGVFDQQRNKLGGTFEARSAFGGTTAEPYRDCLAALIDLGRPEEAFHVLERGRARAFLDLLAQRDLRWTEDLPPALAQERGQIHAEYDRTQAALSRLSLVRDQAEIDRLLVRLRELRVRQEEIAAKILQASPRTAALQDPRPFDLAGARAILDPGTVFLAWSIGRERSFLFVVHPAGRQPGLEVFPLAVGDQALQDRVKAFRNLVQNAGSDQAALSRSARELYDSLLRPAEPWLAAAQRILVSPDGPLHILPFAALVRDGRWLAEQKPIHTVLSATVYAELRRARREGPGPARAALAAFGDPSYPPAVAGQSSTIHREVRMALDRGLSLTPLPSTREEVRGIAAFYPGARAFLGADATEERAKAIGRSARYLHFACHGLLDERFPLNSGLALTIPERPVEGGDNGLLQAWEIFENMRLDADLVTLSACDSALGQEMGGEGLLGLTRAFQYAGARSVLASLWSIADVSTADLMKRFYGYLRKGKSKDEALRAAQADLIRSQDFAHPYHWAAFQLAGDWR
jgi:CHAT domain-containing protein/tetratricopeptide (TPR) repeat protein